MKSLVLKKIMKMCMKNIQQNMKVQPIQKETLKISPTVVSRFAFTSKDFAILSFVNKTSHKFM